MDLSDSAPSNRDLQRQRGEHRRQRHLGLGMRDQLTRTLPYSAAPPPTQLSCRNLHHPPVYAIPATIRGFRPAPSAPSPTRPNPRLSAAPQDDLRRLNLPPPPALEIPQRRRTPARRQRPNPSSPALALISHNTPAPKIRRTPKYTPQAYCQPPPYPV